MLGAGQEVKFVGMKSVATGEADEKHEDECSEECRELEAEVAILG
jgi:hypothetical protein